MDATLGKLLGVTVNSRKVVEPPEVARQLEPIELPLLALKEKMLLPDRRS